MNKLHQKSLLETVNRPGSSWKINPPLDEALKGYLREQVDSGHLAVSKHNHFCLFSGTDRPVSSKWNAGFYPAGESGKPSVISTGDPWTLAQVIAGDWGALAPRERVAEIDDAGWGSPIGGTMVGVAYQGRLETAVVPVEVYQNIPGTRAERFRKHHEVYSEKGVALVRATVGPPAHDLTLRICTGSANIELREKLRGEGYHVIVGEIVGAAQDGLEKAFGDYLAKLTGGRGLYRDPKTISSSECALAYRRIVDDPGMQPFLKTCWKSLREKVVEQC